MEIVHLDLTAKETMFGKSVLSMKKKHQSSVAEAPTEISATLATVVTPAGHTLGRTQSRLYLMVHPARLPRQTIHSHLLLQAVRKIPETILCIPSQVLYYLFKIVIITSTELYDLFFSQVDSPFGSHPPTPSHAAAIPAAPAVPVAAVTYRDWMENFVVLISKGVGVGKLAVIVQRPDEVRVSYLFYMG